MDFYQSLGVAKRINAAACYTALGGSIMSDQVLAAMNDAAKSFISLHELQQKAGEKIAKLSMSSVVNSFNFVAIIILDLCYFMFC